MKSDANSYPRRSVFNMRFLAPLAGSVIATLVLMITANVLPRWYLTAAVMGQVEVHVGIWKICSAFSTTSDQRTTLFCGDIAGAMMATQSRDVNPILAAFKAAEAFATIAVILAVVGALASMLIEVQGSRSHRWLLLAPRLLFVVSAVAMAITALSFIALVRNLSLPSGGKYDVTFHIAWSSVATGLVSAIFAHLHHSRKTNVADPLHNIPLQAYFPVDV